MLKNNKSLKAPSKILIALKTCVGLKSQAVQYEFELKR